MTSGERPQTNRSTKKQPEVLFNNRYSKQTISVVEFKYMYWFLCSTVGWPYGLIAHKWC